jgi:hypothetical protein
MRTQSRSCCSLIVCFPIAKGQVVYRSVGNDNRPKSEHLEQGLEFFSFLSGYIEFEYAAAWGLLIHRICCFQEWEVVQYVV